MQSVHNWSSFFFQHIYKYRYNLLCTLDTLINVFSASWECHSVLWPCNWSYPSSPSRLHSRFWRWDLVRKRIFLVNIGMFSNLLLSCLHLGIYASKSFLKVQLSKVKFFNKNIVIWTSARIFFLFLLKMVGELESAMLP